MPQTRSIELPQGFKYRDVFLKGRPRHDPFDAFSIRHPKMSAGKRAKIFAPFAALKGYDDEVASKEVLYSAKKELSAEESQELGRRLDILHNLTWNSRMARENHVVITVTYFDVCTDSHHEACGHLGQYQAVTGVCRKVDEVGQTLFVGDRQIPFDQISCIRSENPNLFQMQHSPYADSETDCAI